MKAEDKANELFTKYYRLFSITLENTISEYEAIHCAKICVQEIINSNPHSNPLNTQVDSTMGYWQEVLNHLNEM